MITASVNFSTGLSNAWSEVATFVPKFVVFVIIVIVGYLIARALEKIVSRILIRVGFDRVADRGGIKTALARSKYDASGILARIVYYAIMLFVLDVAFGVFGSNPSADSCTPSSPTCRWSSLPSSSSSSPPLSPQP
jgi:Conserved TM helix